MGRTLAGLPGAVFEELSTAFPDADLRRARWQNGAFHFVALCDASVVVRVRVGGDHRAAVTREVDAMRWFSRLPLAARTPGVQRGPVDGGGWSAFSCDLMPGEPMRPADWQDDRGVLLPLLEDLASVVPPPLPASDGLRAWCGGERWPTIVDEITAAWTRSSRRAALAAMEVVLQEAPEVAVAVHGDFGPHNVLLGPAGTALIDPDNAGVGEPETDLAPLLGFYPQDDLSRDFSAARMRRAAEIKRVLPLQVAAAAELAADGSLRDHALGNFLRREARR